MEIITMRMNRRNVLVGLGTIVAGGGAALGTGAFSSVEADRSVTVETTGDGDAYLGISVDGDYATDDSSGDGAAEINLGESYNDDAVTTVNGVLTLTNNAADDEEIHVSFGDDESHSSTAEIDIDGAVVEFTLNETNGGEYQSLSNNESVEINAEIDTREDPLESGGDPEDLTLYAADP
ncbi:hypothetical protein [Natronorubrum texcoconense]|uniref:Uncharacterized protein n=1 Tax=Natronorubrum texcoconense TaxID=1095776 RepID=A0A1G9EZH5_9EURY|nr:hypothetical protein [Natronorubrum texcoconense]SDK81589.1 hypothetical protein SAMN04515672_4038 [Natronorubrum texcoconense]